MASPKIDRLVASRGPAMVTHRGGYFFSKEDIVIDFPFNAKGIPSAAFGQLTKIRQGGMATTKFTPIGEFEHLGVLWPYASTLPGTSIFGDADYPLLIQPLDTTQKQLRFKAAGVSKMPDLNFTANDTLIGDVEFKMVGANGVAIDDPARLFVLEDNAIDPDALPYDPAKLIIQAYSNRWLSGGTWLPSYNAIAATGGASAYNADVAAVQAKLRTIAGGILDDVTVTGNYTDGFTVTDPDDDINAALFTAALTGMPGGAALKASQVSARVVLLQLFPWANFAAREGMKVAFNMTVEDDKSDAIGPYDSIFKELDVVVTGQPQGVDEATMLAAAMIQGAGSVPGTKLGVGAHDLDIVGDNVFFRLYAANQQKAGLVYGATNQRIPALEWVASRSIAMGGGLNPLFYIGAAAPA
jgi:hypothetical protein